MNAINYLQPIYLNYNKELIEDITGCVMAFPNLKVFHLHYGESKDNAPTTPLLDTIRLLLPQVRVINTLTANGEPNPATFLAYKPVSPEILALIFRRWVEVCYPESQHAALMPLCNANQFHWTDATPEHLEYWAPSWAIALELIRHEYQLGESFKFLFGPGYRANMVEVVSWPPFPHARGHRASISLTISTQSDIDPKRINLHFGMKRWLVKQGDNSGVRLEKDTTRCYVRQLRSWLGDYSLLEPNAFTVLKANYRREGNSYIPQWKDRQLHEILERLTVNIPDITDVLTNPLRFIGTNQMDILLPARSYQKAGWGTGVPFSDEQDLLEQIRAILPSNAVLPDPWRKILVVGDLKKSIKQRFQKIPIISSSSTGELPELSSQLKVFLAERANNLTIRVCCRTQEVQKALAQVAKHYFADSLTLEFLSLEGLADPISERKSKRNGKVPEIQHIRQFGQRNQPGVPTPMIVEILPPDHPTYRNGSDPHNYIKSLLPQYNLIPKCILSSEALTSDEFEAVESDEAQLNNLNYRALSTIIGTILPFNQDYPLSPFDGSLCNDNTVYAGFYVIRRNEKTANQSFSEPVLVAIYNNQVNVLLPAIDLQFRSMADAICELARPRTPKINADQVISNMLSTLTQFYSAADDMYLYVDAQNARTYWTWIQDSKFDVVKPPSNKIHIIRIRDQSNYEVPQVYGLSIKETFEKGVTSFAQGIFISEDYVPGKTLFTQTVLSVAEKPLTSRGLSKQMSRFKPWVSKGDVSRNPSPTKPWKAPQPRAHNILATSSPEQFKLHHAIAHHLRSCHWWTSAECEYPVPLSLAAKLKNWCFNESESEELSDDLR